MQSKRKPAFVPARPARRLPTAAVPGAAPVQSSAAQQDQASVIELFNEASRLSHGGDKAGAIRLYEAWLARGQPSAWRHAVLFNLGVAQMGLNGLDEAEHSFRAALELQPGFHQAAFNLGTLMEKRGQVEEAVACWARLTALPDDAAGESRNMLILALNNSGRLLETRKAYAEAEVHLTRSLRIDPEQPQVIHHLVHLRQKQCAWPVLAELPGVSWRKMIAHTSALAMLDVSDDPALQLAAARRFVEEKVEAGLARLAPDGGYGHRRVRIGYLSSDLCLHPVSMLMVELFELHDRDNFEVYAFCWSRDDGSALRQRVIAALDHHIRIGDMSDEQAAACIRQHEIDVLIDLQGLTSGARPNILARHPAPFQVSYLGFPGTSGMPFVDHILCDRYVLPPEEQPHFTEKPLYMPRVFQMCDRKRPVAATPTRASCGLPEDGFVFCAFNNNHKYTPESFDTWLRILAQVPGSVLWLLADNASVRPNLVRRCEAAGVSPDRLVFADRVLPPEYLARYRLADLFLDCFPFNGGTTVNDALWMGVPVLTRSGRSFASRMAGSLLCSLGLDELVVSDFEAYERAAVALARPGSRLAAVKARLATARDDSALFDTRQQTRDVEDLLLGVLGRRREAPVPGTARPMVQAQQDAAALSIFNYRVPAQGIDSDPARFEALMDEAVRLAPSGHYLGGQMFAWGMHNSLFDDAAFRDTWMRHAGTLQTRLPPWACYLMLCNAQQGLALPGDFVEFAGDRAPCAPAVLDYLQAGGEVFGRGFLLHQDLPGTPPPAPEPLRQLGGSLFDLPDEVLPARIAWLHLHLPAGPALLAALERCFDRLVPGAAVWLGGYERDVERRTQKQAVDAWLSARGHRVMPLPTGQGLVIRH